MTRIIFVDDDQAVLDGLRRTLHLQRDEWHMDFVQDPIDALVLMDDAPVDVVIADMAMPEMDGFQLMEQIKLRHPEVVRIILSGQFKTSTSLELIGVAHQFLAKPCDPEVLIDVIVRASALRTRISDQALLRLVSGTTSLPSPPARFGELMRLVRSPDSSLAEIAAVISTDTGMTAKVLQLVNSSFFGLRRQITDPSQAVAILGLNNLVALALGAHIFTRMSKAVEAGLNLDHEHDRSLAVAAGAEAIARSAGLDPAATSPYYLAGMLHDAGRLVLASNFPLRYQAAAAAHADDLVATERAEFGASHQEVGAYLLGVWGLPDEIVEAAAFHHEPSESSVRQLAPTTAVHIAQSIADATDGPPHFDEGCLEECGDPTTVSLWKETALEAMIPHLAPEIEAEVA